MKFSRFSQYLEKLEATSSLLEMTEQLAKLFRETSVREIGRVSYLSLGELAPPFRAVRFNIAGKMMMRIVSRTLGVDKKRVAKLFSSKGDFGEVIEALGQKHALRGKGPTVGAVYEKLREIAEAAGTGSQEEKISGFSELLRSLDPLSAKYLVRIALGKLRLGFADKTLLDSLSWMARGDKSLRNSENPEIFSS